MTEGRIRDRAESERVATMSKAQGEMEWNGVNGLAIR